MRRDGLGFVGKELEAEDAAKVVGVVRDERFLLVEGGKWRRERLAP